MSNMLVAFPRIGRLRPIRPLVEPALATVILIAGGLSVATDGMTAVAVVLFSALAVAVARLIPWFSLAALTIAFGIFAVGEAWRSLMWALVVAAVAISIVAAARRRVERWIALAYAVFLGLAAPIVLNWAYRAYADWTAYALTFVIFVGAWGMGTAAGEASARLRAVQQSSHLSQQLDASRLELALIAERERVAQEVHDVVAHSLAVILAQAEGARALADRRPKAMAEALDRIADASRSALLDVRGIVDGLSGGAEPPQPTMEDLPELLSHVADAGIDVRSTSAGIPRELGDAQATAVYRIVQEGFTNAIRHRGRGSAVDLVFDWRGPGLSIQLVSSGLGDAVSAGGAGRGVPGMTERARIAGGWLVAGEDESGDHRITAFIPYRDAVAPASLPEPA